MSKPFLDAMSKEERQAFSYLEKLIHQSKMECLAAIPQTRVYNDSEIIQRLQSLETQTMNYQNDVNFTKNLNPRLVVAITETQEYSKTLGKRMSLIYGYLSLIQKLAEKEFLGVEIDADQRKKAKKVIENNYKEMISLMDTWDDERLRGVSV
jgi:hypothetical protein